MNDPLTIFMLVGTLCLAVLLIRVYKQVKYAEEHPVVLEVYPQGNEWIAVAYKRGEHPSWETDLYNRPWKKVSRGHQTRESAEASGEVLACNMLRSIEEARIFEVQRKIQKSKKDFGLEDC